MTLAENILPTGQTVKAELVRLHSTGTPRRDLGPRVMIRLGGENTLYVHPEDFAQFIKTMHMVHAALPERLA
jgi:hypothetical protein